MFVGEQPGDQEDRAGKPFVGPAGRLLDKALAEAGIDRSATYMTNAVKHFKWQARGERRIHPKPTWAEITAFPPRPQGQAPSGSPPRSRPPRATPAPSPPRPEVPRPQAPAQLV